MVTAEAVTYALCGLSVGSIFGLLLHRRLTTQLILEHFGGVWHIPITPIVIIIAIIILSCILAVYSPAKRIKNMSVTDTLNEH
jgi:putative ABC transport system permease protein